MAQEKPAEKVAFHEGKTGSSQFVDSYQWIGIGDYNVLQ
jgi:hypothetical protein